MAAKKAGRKKKAGKRKASRSSSEEHEPGPLFLAEFRDSVGEWRILVLDLEARQVKVRRPGGFADAEDHWFTMSKMRKLSMVDVL